MTSPSKFKLAAFEEALSTAVRHLASVPHTGVRTPDGPKTKAPEQWARQPKEDDINLAYARLALHCKNADLVHKYKQIVGGGSVANLAEFIGLMRTELGGNGALIDPSSYTWMYGARQDVQA